MDTHQWGKTLLVVDKFVVFILLPAASLIEGTNPLTWRLFNFINKLMMVL